MMYYHILGERQRGLGFWLVLGRYRRSDGVNDNRTLVRDHARFRCCTFCGRSSHPIGNSFIGDHSLTGKNAFTSDHGAHHLSAFLISGDLPDSETLFRFYEVEYSLACGMDGERDVPGIVKWAQEELGLSPTPQEVRTVIATLGDLGFIATGEAAATPPTA